MNDAVIGLSDYISQRLDDKIQHSEIEFGELTLSAKREDLVDLVRALHDDPNLKFVCFIDLCGVDYPEREQRFEIVYHLLSPTQNARVRIKISTDENTPVPSIVDIFPGANWCEREAFDLYGVRFVDHPDMRRILTDYGFDGHPLRKDFPTTGYVELRYDEERKRVVYEPVKLAQEFRTFDYLSPWEGADYVLPGDEKASGEAEQK